MGRLAVRRRIPPRSCSCPADDDADGGVFAGEPFLRVEGFEVELHLAFVLGLEGADLEVNGHERPQPPACFWVLETMAAIGSRSAKAMSRPVA